MKLRTLLLAATLSLGACSNLIQTASISEAYKLYEREDYNRALELITQAEHADEMTAEMKAELTYLKAQTHDKLDQGKIATALYQYLADEHRNSQYGYLAKKQLSSSL